VYLLKQTININFLYETFVLTYTYQGYNIGFNKTYSPSGYTRGVKLNTTTVKNNDALLNRLKRLEGQMRGLQSMIAEDRYCIDVLVQITAIQSALKQVGFIVTEDHISNCVSEGIKNGNGEESIKELMVVLKQFSK
jgi:DNA-binding FrmR family transcriptional regulator